MKSLFGFVATILVCCLCSFSAFAQKYIDDDGNIGGWDNFPIIINNVTIIQPNSCVDGRGQQSTGSMLINISINFPASLPSTVFVGWEDARGKEYGQMATVTQPPFIT